MDWCDENWEEMEPAVEAKLAACLILENHSCQATKDALRATNNRCQQTAWCCGSDHWLKPSQRFQAEANSGNTGSMYGASNKVQARWPPRASHWRPSQAIRQKEAAGAVDRALPWALLRAEHHDLCSAGHYQPAACLRQSGQGTYSRGAQQGHRLSCYRQSP